MVRPVTVSEAQDQLFETARNDAGSWGNQGDGTFHVPRLPACRAARRRLISRYRLVLVQEGAYPYDLRIPAYRPVIAALFLHGVLDGFDRELLGALYLDVHRRAIGHTVAYVGNLWGTLCDPRGIYAPALLVNAAYVVLFHSHPSGDPDPSPEDQTMTERVAAAGKVLTIPLLDHLILGERPRYVSLGQLGRMP